ncbi:MAG: CoA ester lyase [Hyphomicrobiales bacterium]|nr:CoA ester lyase [Hyphomicrobiales bacterium]
MQIADAQLASRSDLKPRWRSLLFVPAILDRFFERAIDAKPDAIIIDLEDSIPIEQKEFARRQVRETAAVLRRAGADVLVRINRPLSLAVRDIEASIGADVCAIMVPKAGGAYHLKLLCEVIDEIENGCGIPGRTKIVPLVEDAEAVCRLKEIAEGERVVAIACGDEDLAANLGCAPESQTLVSVKHQLVLAAGAAGCQPLGLIGTITEYRDLDRFRAAARSSCAAGLTGSLCIHPSQVTIANKEFAPSQEAVEWALRVIARADDAQRMGQAVTSLDGKMIDQPVVRRAREILQFHIKDERGGAYPCLSVCV